MNLDNKRTLLLFCICTVNTVFANSLFLKTTLEEDIERAKHISGWEQQAWTDEEKGTELKSYFIYEVHEFPLTVCIDKQNIAPRMVKQHKHAIKLWNITYRKRKHELFDQGYLSEHEFKRQTPNSSYGLFKLLNCQDDSSLKKVHIFASYWNMKTKKINPLGALTYERTFNCDWWDYISVGMSCLAFKNELRKIIGFNLSRIKTNDYEYTTWKQIDPNSSKVKITRKHFAYKNVVHELGHALGIPHIDGTIMEHSDTCRNTKSGICQIADQLIDFFIGYYVSDLEKRQEQRKLEELRVIRRKRLELRRRNQRRREHLREIRKLREREQEQTLSRMQNVSLEEIESEIEETKEFIAHKFQERRRLLNEYHMNNNDFYNQSLKSVEDQITRAQVHLSLLHNVHISRLLGLPIL